MVDAGRALGLLYQYARAEDLLGRASELGHASGQVLELVGQSFRLIRRPEKAEDCLRQAVARNASLPDTHLELAILLERKGNIQEAKEHCERRMRLLPNDKESQCLLGLLHRRAGNIDQAEKLFMGVASDAQTHPQTRARAYSELSKLLDEVGNFRDAWKEMLAGKALLSSGANDARAHRQRIVDPLFKLVSELRKDDVEQWTQSGPERSPPNCILLTGLPRSGTTLVAKLLSAAPEAAVADEYDIFPKMIFPMLLGRETPESFSAEKLAGLDPRQIVRLRESYITFFRSAVLCTSNTQVFIDKNPSLLPLAPFFFRLFGQRSLAVVLRDPRDILVSCLFEFHKLNDFTVDFLTVTAAVERLASDLQAWRTLRELLPVESYHEIVYEDFVAAPEQQLKQLTQRLELTCGSPTESNLKVFSPSYHQASQAVHAWSIGRWENYQAELSTVLPRLDQLASLIALR